jgi:hypothetical protein
MLEAGSPLRHHLVGAWRWVDASTVCWFTAHGDSPLDAHILHFDEAEEDGKGGVCFRQKETVVGHLTPINQAGVEDPDDYVIGWQIWQEVAPLHAPLVARALESRQQDGLSLNRPSIGRGPHLRELEYVLFADCQKN